MKKAAVGDVTLNHRLEKHELWRVPRASDEDIPQTRARFKNSLTFDAFKEKRILTGWPFPNGSMHWGTHPSRLGSVLTGPRQKRDNKPADRANGQIGDFERGAGENPAGSGWPPIKGIAWIQCRKVRCCSLSRGSSGWRSIV